MAGQIALWIAREVPLWETDMPSGSDDKHVSAFTNSHMQSLKILFVVVFLPLLNLYLSLDNMSDFEVSTERESLG